MTDQVKTKMDILFERFVSGDPTLDIDSLPKEDLFKLAQMHVKRTLDLLNDPKYVEDFLIHHPEYSK
jgi:hypothetical protein